MRFRTFSDAKIFVHSRNLKSRNKWLEFCKSGKKPDDIPMYPNEYYKDKGWISWGDWLGTNTIAHQNRKFRPFSEARDYARSLNLPGVKEWEEYCKSGKKPDDIPWSPSRSYKNKGWQGWGDWLDVGILSKMAEQVSFTIIKEAVKYKRFETYRDIEI